MDAFGDGGQAIWAFGLSPAFNACRRNDKFFINSVTVMTYLIKILSLY
jgi:hypothetical protein